MQYDFFFFLFLSFQVIAESSAVIRSRRQVVAMLIAVVFFFFACILPFKVLTLWIVASPLEILDVINQETYFNLLYFSRLMFYINSAINPILYNIMSSKFRDGFKRVFNCKVWTSRRHGFGHSSIYTNGMIQTTTGVTGLDNSPANRTFMERMNSSILLRRSPNRSTITTTVHSEADTQQQQPHFFVNSPSGKGRTNRPRASTHSHCSSNSVSKKLSLSKRESSKSSFFDLKDDMSSSVFRGVGGSQSLSQARPNALSSRRQSNKATSCGKSFSRCSSKVEPPSKSTTPNENFPPTMTITNTPNAKTTTVDATPGDEGVSPEGTIPSQENQARLEEDADRTLPDNLEIQEERLTNESDNPTRELSPSCSFNVLPPSSCPSIECPLPDPNRRHHNHHHYDLRQDEDHRHNRHHHHHHNYHHHHHHHHNHPQQEHSHGDIAQSPKTSITVAEHHHHHQEPSHLSKAADINFTSNPLFHAKIGSDELVI